MVDSFSGWLFNVILWGAIATFVLLLAETAWRGSLAGEIDVMKGVIGMGAIAVLALWPRF